MRLAEIGETLLEADGVGASLRIASGYGAANARMTPLESDFAHAEAEHAAFFGTEEMVFPESRDAVDLEIGTETEAGFGERDLREPAADGFESSGGDDGGAAGDGVVGDAGGIVTDDGGTIQQIGEPGGGRFGVGREGEGGGGNVAASVGDGECCSGKIGSVGCADCVQDGSARGGNEGAIDGIESPSAIESKATGRAYRCGGNFDGVEGFYGMDLDAGEAGSCGGRLGRVHGVILTEWTKTEGEQDRKSGRDTV